MDLYILPKNIKQVLIHCCIAAQHTRNLYIEVVLGITMILHILFNSLLLSHSHPTSPYTNKYIEISCKGAAALRHQILHGLHSHKLVSQEI